MPLTFDEGTHTYRLDGQVVPSVTQVIEHAQFVDPTWFTEESRLRGTLVHRVVELYDQGKISHNPGVPPEAQGYLDAWVRFKREADFVTEESEVRLASHLFRFAGTLDKSGSFRLPHSSERTHAIIDLKTGKLLPWWGLQLSGYQILELERHERFCRRFDLELHDDGTYNLHEQRDVQDRGVFLAALTCWHWIQKHC